MCRASISTESDAAAPRTHRATLGADGAEPDGPGRRRPPPPVACSRPPRPARPDGARRLAGRDGGDEAIVAEIDPELADTAAFCERYGVGLDVSANCVVVAGRRGGETRFAACVVLATTRADVNGVVRRRLDARKASFAAMDLAVAETGMEYGGITPIGLPAGWPLLVDARVDVRHG